MILFTIYIVFFSFDPVRRRMPRYRKRLFLGSFQILSKQSSAFSDYFAVRKKAAEAAFRISFPQMYSFIAASAAAGITIGSMLSNCDRAVSENIPDIP